jgi:hypothetical protein
MQITGVLLGIFVLYAVLFLPESLFAELRESFGLLAEYVVRLGGALSAGVVTRWVMFTQDTLANGDSIWSKYFRSQFPHNVIIDKYGCSGAEGSGLWFTYFNSWEDGSASYQAHHARTFYRSYGCRLIYHLKQWLFFFAVGGALTLFIIRISGTTFTRWTPCFLLIAMSIALFVILWRANRIPNDLERMRPAFLAQFLKPSTEATGCWRKFEEISEIQRVLLERDILSRAETLEEAWGLVKELERRANENQPDRSSSRVVPGMSEGDASRGAES